MYNEQKIWRVATSVVVIPCHIVYPDTDCNSHLHHREEELTVKYLDENIRFTN